MGNLTAVKILHRISAIAQHPQQTCIAIDQSNGIVLIDLILDEIIGQPFILQPDVQVESLAFNHDGSILAAAYYTYRGFGAEDVIGLQIWDTTSHRPLGPAFAPGKSRIKQMVFSQDASTLVLLNRDGQIFWWDVKKQTPIAVDLTGAMPGATCIAASPNGKFLASGQDDNTVQLWDIMTQRPLGVSLAGHKPLRTILSGFSRGLNCLAFSPDCQFLAAGSKDGTLRLWDIIKHKAHGPALSHGESVLTLAFSPDGRLLASGGGDGISGSSDSDNKVRLWTVEKPASLGSIFYGHLGTIPFLKFSPDGHSIIAGSLSGRCWHIKSHAIATPAIAGHFKKIDCLALSPDGQLLASTSFEKGIQLWDVSRHIFLQELNRTSTAVTCLAFSPDSNYLAAGTIGAFGSGAHADTLWLWDLRKKCLLASNDIMREVKALIFSADSQQLIVADRHQQVCVWDFFHGLVKPRIFLTTEKTTRPERDFYKLMTLSADGQYLAMVNYLRGTELSTAWLGDLQQKELRGLSVPDDRVIGPPTAIAFSPNNKFLAIASTDNGSRQRNTIALWDRAKNQRLAKSFQGHNQLISHMAFTSNSLFIISVSQDRTLRIWDIDSDRCVEVLQWNHTIISIAMIPYPATSSSSATEDLCVIGDGGGVFSYWRINVNTGSLHFQGMPQQPNMQLLGNQAKLGSCRLDKLGQRLLSQQIKMNWSPVAGFPEVSPDQESRLMAGALDSKLTSSFDTLSRLFMENDFLEPETATDSLAAVPSRPASPRASSAPSALFAPSAINSNELLQKANSYFQQHRYQEAAESYSTLLKRYRLQGLSLLRQIHYGLGVSQWKLNLLKEAQENLSTAVGFDNLLIRTGKPSFSKCHDMLAQCEATLAAAILTEASHLSKPS